LYSHSDTACLLIQSNCTELQPSINILILVARFYHYSVYTIKEFCKKAGAFTFRAMVITADLPLLKDTDSIRKMLTLNHYWPWYFITTLLTSSEVTDVDDMHKNQN
jgi:hypothetical protein